MLVVIALLMNEDASDHSMAIITSQNIPRTALKACIKKLVVGQRTSVIMHGTVYTLNIRMLQHGCTPAKLDLRWLQVQDQGSRVAFGSG